MNPEQPNKPVRQYTKEEEDTIRAAFEAESAKWTEYDENGKEKTFFDYSAEELEKMPPERSILLYAKATFKDQHEAKKNERKLE
jgi:hypothetical protein